MSDRGPPGVVRKQQPIGLSANAICETVAIMSGLPGDSDRRAESRFGSFVPKSDIDSITIRPLGWQGS